MEKVIEMVLDGRMALVILFLAAVLAVAVVETYHWWEHRQWLKQRRIAREKLKELGGK